MAERFIEFHLESQSGINWNQLRAFYSACGIERDIDEAQEAYPEIELIESWHDDDIPEEMAKDFERKARDFGIRVVYLIRPKSDGIPPFLRKAA